MRNVAAHPASRTRSDISDELLDACDAKLQQSVVIVGPGQVDLVAALCRRGFLRVMWQAAYDGLHRLDAPIDVLILRNCPSEQKLRHVLVRYGRAMGEGAGVVLCTPSFGTFHSLPHLQILLAEHALHLGLRSKRLPNGLMLHIARKCDVPACAVPAPTTAPAAPARRAHVFNA